MNPLTTTVTRPSTSAQRRAGVYVRISKDRHCQAGVRRQEADCVELAKQLGWSVVDVYVDNDVEASSGRPRPAYLRLLEDMRSGLINAVIGWHSDRIVRRPVELEELIELADQHDVLFAAVKVGNLDLSNASGRLVARLLGATAKYETELKGERQSAQLRRAGTGGPPDRRRHAALRLGSRRHACRPQGGGRGSRSSGTGSRREVDRLAHRMAHRHGGCFRVRQPWSPTVLRRLLLSPRIAGIATYRGMSWQGPVGRLDR